MTDLDGNLMGSRITLETNHWVCLWGSFLDDVNHHSVTRPECGQRHSMGWDPRLNEMDGESEWSSSTHHRYSLIVVQCDQLPHTLVSTTSQP